MKLPHKLGPEGREGRKFVGKNGKQAVLLLTLVFFCGIFRGQLFRHARLMNLSGNLRESSVFREMEFSPGGIGLTGRAHGGWI